MSIQFESVDIADVKQRLAKRTRTSKWREQVQAFMDADIPAAKVTSDEDDFKPSSVASGLNNALKGAKDAGSAFPVQVVQRRDTDGTQNVYLIRTDLVELNAEEADDAEAVEA